ncbi:MAG: hypothetical protein KC464_10860, partial [Myxococcales bacterium]|nr:hypothetical protein [Myxococcales bacterium]
VDTGAGAAPDSNELRAAWFGLVGHREPAPPGSAPAASAMITRGRVLRAVGADWARPLPTAALRRVLARMAEDELPVSITVGNEACTQSCVGVMRVEDGDGATLVAAGHDGGVVVRGLDRGGCWAVREPRPRDAAWCLEAHDADGDLIATFQVARVGDVEVWNQRLAREPDAPDAGR